MKKSQVKNIIKEIFSKKKPIEKFKSLDDRVYGDINKYEVGKEYKIGNYGNVDDKWKGVILKIAKIDSHTKRIYYDYVSNPKEYTPSLGRFFELNSSVDGWLEPVSDEIKETSNNKEIKYPSMILNDVDKTIYKKKWKDIPDEQKSEITNKINQQDKEGIKYFFIQTPSGSGKLLNDMWKKYKSYLLPLKTESHSNTSQTRYFYKGPINIIVKLKAELPREAQIGGIFNIKTGYWD